MASGKEAAHDSSFALVNTICGGISPKSIVHNGNGIFFAQNMMYRHTITVYDRNMQLLSTITDKVKLADHGYSEKPEWQKGAPVECAFTQNGKYAWVSNYQMFGDEFSNAGCDNCFGRNDYDPSFVYKINTSNYKIENVVKVGAVPKDLAASHNDKLVLVSNWTSGEISVIDAIQNIELRKVYVGRFPRGITISSNDSVAYVAVMGSKDIATIDLSTFEVSWIEDVGRSPRHLCISADDRFLYASLNGEGKLAKIDLKTNEVLKTTTGRMPRSMELSADGRFLYVVNYGDNTVAKVATADMGVRSTLETKSKPIGITLDQQEGAVWVCCYTGCIMKFSDVDLKTEEIPEPLFAKVDFGVPDRFIPADQDMDGKLSVSEVEWAIEEFLDGNSVYQVTGINEMISYVLE
jgi:YVTN family beta-propeller protein